MIERAQDNIATGIRSKGHGKGNYYRTFEAPTPDRVIHETSYPQRESPCQVPLGMNGSGLSTHG